MWNCVSLQKQEKQYFYDLVLMLFIPTLNEFVLLAILYTWIYCFWWWPNHFQPPRPVKTCYAAACFFSKLQLRAKYATTRLNTANDEISKDAINALFGITIKKKIIQSFLTFGLFFLLYKGFMRAAKKKELFKD